MNPIFLLGKGPRTCVNIGYEEEKRSSTAGLGLGQRCCGSFTFLQLQELQHQMLIYKYMETGLPVPYHLLIPICKSLATSFPALKGMLTSLFFPSELSFHKKQSYFQNL